MARHSKADAARYLGISRTTLYRLIQQGTLSPTPEGLIDDTELVRAAPHVDAIKARIETSSDSVQERHDTGSDSMQVQHETLRFYKPVDTELQASGQSVTPQDSLQERHDTGVTGRHWTEEGARYGTHLEGEVDMLRVQVHTLQAQVERLHDELREARIARDHAEEAARTERARYVQMLQEFYQRYDRLLDAPRLVPTFPVAAGPRDSTTSPAADRGDIRRRIAALVREHPEGLSPVQARQLLGLDKDLGATMKGMRRDGLLRRVALGQYTAAD
jgi:outer membrane murein-binding lipoprotein Lpp